MAKTQTVLDAISLEIFWNRLISIADESAAALLRTSFSTIVRESNDFTTALMDAQGNALAENTAGIPSFMGTLPRTLRQFLTRFPIESWKAGDCVITNDPWIGTGHLPDVTMVMPIFYKGKLVAFSGTVAHLPDIGGSLWASDCRDLFEEGLQIPPVKYYDAGKPNALVLQFIAGNVRVPDQVLGDLEAQVIANTVAAKRVQEFLDDTGVDDLEALSSALQDRAEQAMRRAIEAIPDGVYRSTVMADGFDADETRIECAITVKGSSLHVDYSGTSKQIDRGLNSVMTYTYAYSVYPIKCAIDPLTPRNEGSYRSVTVEAPEGCILNPRYPAPCSARQLTGHLLSGAIYAALGQAIPNDVIAESGSAPTLRSVYSGVDRQGNRFSQVFFAAGGMGASTSQDGHHCTSFPTNTGSGSIEAFEATAPLIVLRKEFVPDSGGIGKFRGGLGQEVEIQVASPEALRLSLLSDRQKYPPLGLFGGGSGAPVSIMTGSGRHPHPKSRTTLDPGERLILKFAGGAGAGSPSERDREAIINDLRNGYVTSDAARRDYSIEI